VTIQLEDILRLSVSERVRLVEDIWDSIAASPEALRITEQQRQELDRRLAAHARDPSEVRSWDQICARLEQRE